MGPLRETTNVVTFLLANFIGQSNVVLTISPKINVTHGELNVPLIILILIHLTGASEQFSVYDVYHVGQENKVIVYLYQYLSLF